MKIISKGNGRTIATGRFETSKIFDMSIEAENKDTWVVFSYLCDNFIRKIKPQFLCLYVVAELNIKDGFVNFDACEFETGYDITATIQLTMEERERFFIYVISHILGKDT